MRVGFIGLGDIGMPMAERLIECGFDVTVNDIQEDKSIRLSSSGAKVARSVSELWDCHVVCVAVPDDSAVEKILLDDGLLDSLEDGAVVLIHSTILPATARSLSTSASDRNVVVLDAPVSGGAARAKTGDLVIMFGGDAAGLDKCREVFDALAAQSIHVGPSGAGAAVKLANQLAMLAGVAALQEGLAPAEHYGATEELALIALQAGTGDSWVARNWTFFDNLVRTYDKAGVPVRFRPWSKDLWDVVASAREAEFSVRLAGMLSWYLAEAVEDHAAASTSNGD